MKNILYITSLLITILSCSKDNNEDCFKGRDKGDGTISFYINGELWQNSCSFNNSGSINGTANESMYVGHYNNFQNMEIVGKIWNDNKSIIYIGISDTTSNLEQNLENGMLIYDGLLDSFNHCKMTLLYMNQEYISKSDNGFVKITKRIDGSDDNNLPSHHEGVFEATLFNVNDSTDFIKITDGFWNN